MRQEDIEYFEKQFRKKLEKQKDKYGLEYYKDTYVNYLFAGFQMGMKYKQREIEILIDELNDSRKLIKSNILN